MTKRNTNTENYSILKAPNTCVRAEDYLDMTKDEHKRCTLYVINGEQVLYMLDALEFYAKHYKKIVPARVAKAMKRQSDDIHIEIVDAWQKGVRVDADNWEPLEFDISELLGDDEDYDTGD